MKRLQATLIIAVLICLCSPALYAKVNINLASAPELERLPRIGPGLAQTIIDYRQLHGPFYSIEAIMNVPRVGAKTFAGLRDLITVGNTSADTPQTQAAPVNTGMSPITKNAPEPAPEAPPGPTVEEVLAHFAGEPSITDVQNAAMRYAQINPAQFVMWRENAKSKALAPDKLEMKVVYDTDDDTDYARSRSISLTGGTVTVGPDDETWGHDTDSDWKYEIKMRWNPQDYMFNSDMLKVAAETEDQVELRQDILQEITTLYFDRRRLQVEIVMEPNVSVRQDLTRKIRMDELTAVIDGLTGGYFSQQLANTQP